LFLPVNVVILLFYHTASVIRTRNLNLALSCDPIFTFTFAFFSPLLSFCDHLCGITCVVSQLHGNVGCAKLRFNCVVVRAPLFVSVAAIRLYSKCSLASMQRLSAVASPLPLPQHPVPAHLPPLLRVLLLAQRQWRRSFLPPRTS
jgi:hypothetical protein